MVALKKLIQNCSPLKIIGSLDISVDAISIDSRKVKKNGLFLAVKGTLVDGHQFIEKAIQNGATAIICESIPEKILDSVVYIQVSNTVDVQEIVVPRFYDYPSTKIKLIGITGTNGKTSVATLLYQLFKNMGYSVGLLSTVHVRINDTIHDATHTTPDSITLNHYLNKMVEQGVSHCFMEVSSHGIEQGRVNGLDFDGGVFTNLSHDHLDYHKNFETYKYVKKKFFDSLPKSAFAISNSDDKSGLFMLQNTRAEKYTYALKKIADFKAKLIENSLTGMTISINGNEFISRLTGAFNTYNLTAVFAVSQLLGLEEMEVLAQISQLENVTGRFQQFTSNINKITTIVDYAHTPDALKNVLKSIHSVRKKSQKIITVVGCGGNRDQTKRSKMGMIAVLLSDLLILTSDNPRDENPEVIIRDMQTEMNPEQLQKSITIENREEAIKTASKIAQPKDIILIAGKGHETYQEIKGQKKYFNDFELITNLLK